MKKSPFEKTTDFLLIGLAAAGFAAVIVLNAWVNDDAYITFRVVDNFVNGFGLRWNIADRVQVFTHPLWMLLISGVYFFTREAYLTSLTVSWILSIAVIWFVAKIFKDQKIAGLSILFLGLSTAYVEYSTSGLENSLGHLLAVVFIWYYFSEREISQDKRLLYLSLIASLAIITRHDYILLYAPVLFVEFIQAAKQISLRVAFKPLLIGMVPVLAWEIFSMVYYGFPFPNTYYAKTQNFVIFSRNASQALHYFEYTLIYDPITLLVIFFGSLLGISFQKTRLLTLGVLLYLMYIFSIGGDFMGGRFFSVPYIIALLVMMVGLKEVLRKWDTPAARIIAVISMTTIAGLQILYANSPTYLPYAKGFETADHFNVKDQRMLYSPTSFIETDEIYDYWISKDYLPLNKTVDIILLLLQGELHRTEIAHDFIEKGQQLNQQAINAGGLGPEIISAAGFVGYYSGPTVHLIDRLALGDAFLAQLPPINKALWKPGHFERYILPDYEEILLGQRAHIETPASVDPLFQQVELITKAPLFQWDRIKAIADINLHPKYSSLSPEAILLFRYPNRMMVEEGQWARYPALGVGYPLWIEAQSASIELQMSGYELFFIEQLSRDGVRLKATTVKCEQEECVTSVDLEADAWNLIVFPSQGYHLGYEKGEIKIKYRILDKRPAEQGSIP